MRPRSPQATGACAALLGGLALLSGGCGQGLIMKAMTPREDERLARSYLTTLRNHDLARIEQDLDPSLRNATVREALAHLVPQFPPQEPQSTTIVGVHTWRAPDVYVSNISFELQYPDQWLLTNVAVQKKHGVSSIVGLNVVPIADSLEHFNRFTLSGRSGLQYTVLALAVAVPLLVLYALILAIRTPMSWRKWPWIVFILFGVGRFAVDWTSGAHSYGWLAVQLFGASVWRTFYGPWTLAVSVPLGAICFLLWRRARQPGTP